MKFPTSIPSSHRPKRDQFSSFLISKLCFYYSLWKRELPFNENATRAARMLFTTQIDPCKGIQDSLEFWIPRSGFRISWAVFRILNSAIPDSTTLTTTLAICVWVFFFGQPRAVTFLYRSVFLFLGSCFVHEVETHGWQQSNPYFPKERIKLKVMEIRIKHVSL